ncbi:hypothetical protein PTSG_09120 [Salpingoeca rosetta]|uniref:ATP synthase subunit O n=1 Tax=Salpingoeca rosetta (strain ATCC 50818 / BSB-021) TaxID=946362 RepID=F2UMS5_SALR5|nr:uncharacterized protein PTSG_09120 [Salpingoeca rosetta]EGD78424.1 hypothetical protein PTSG_09120 [Salpingoeca rosetta]|eukprot:XP_004989373.1 hypothetical protein PTSG_09120 [Salpingoeca rosetta]
MSLFRAARHFSSTAANLAQTAKAPIQLFGIEGRYAHALYSAAAKKNALDSVEKELTKFKGYTETDTKFNTFLNNPVITRSQKTKVIQDVLKKQKFSDITVNFFAALAENNRLTHSVDVIEAFGKLMAATRGEVAATITSAEALSAKHKKALEKALDGFLKSGQKFNLNYQVDGALLGGVVVEMGDRIIDMSVKTQINKYIKSVSQSL